MSRLQVGGLALNLNDGGIVTLVQFIGEWHDQKYGLIKDLWKVKSDQFCVMSNNALRMEFGVPASELIPLGDDKGIELYGFREEIMTRHDKECSQ